jgi:putative acetyltransferase
VAEEYSDPERLDNIWVYDDGIVKGMLHIEGIPLKA